MKPTNKITAKGIFFSCTFIIIHVIVVYCDQYLNLLSTKDQNGNKSYIEGIDVLFLSSLQTPPLLFLCYFTQKQSISQDVPTKHLLLIILNQIITLIQTCLHFVSLWRLGIVIKSIISTISIILLCIAEKVLFKKRLFSADYIGIVFVMLSIGLLLPYRLFAAPSNSKHAPMQGREYIIGFVIELLNGVMATFSNILTEYICKIDYVRAMGKYFGSEKEAKQHMISEDAVTMNTRFWLGVNGIIALPLCILFIVILTFIPRYEASFNVFIFKLIENKWLMLLFFVGAFMLFIKSFIGTEVQINVSSVARKLLRSFCKFPVWIINIYIATNPKKGGIHLDSFDRKRWNEWLLIASFILSAIGVLIYYEIGTPNQCRRSEGSKASTDKLKEIGTRRDYRPSQLVKV